MVDKEEDTADEASVLELGLSEDQIGAEEHLASSILNAVRHSTEDQRKDRSQRSQYHGPRRADKSGIDFDAVRAAAKVALTEPTPSLILPLVLTLVLRIDQGGRSSRGRGSCASFPNYGPPPTRRGHIHLLNPKA